MAGASGDILFVMLLPVPFLIVWLVISVLNDRKKDMRNFKEDQEFGYQDWKGADE